MCPLSGDFVDMLDITSRYINGLQKQLKLEDDKLIEVVKFHFIIVGWKIYNSTDYDIRRRLAIGRTAMTNLERTWGDKDVTIAKKIRLVNALISQVVTCYTIKQRGRKRIV